MGAGMQVPDRTYEENNAHPGIMWHVPWTSKDILLGGLAFLGWMVIFVIIGMLLPFVGVNLDVGLFIGLAEAIMIIPVWWFTIRKYHVSTRMLGIRSFELVHLGWGLGLMLLSFGFNALYSLLLGFVDLQMQVDVAPVFEELNTPIWLLTAGVVVAPIAEELFFRSFMFAGLRENQSWWKAALISSAIFAVLHVQLTAFLPIFLLGMIFATLYQFTGSILPGLIMHILTNGLGLGAAYLISLMG